MIESHSCWLLLDTCMCLFLLLLSLCSCGYTEYELWTFEQTQCLQWLHLKCSQNPSCGGPQLLGGISTNRLLSGSAWLCHYGRGHGFLLWHAERVAIFRIIITVSEAEVSIQDVYRKWIHCKHKNYMTIIELTNEGWWYPLITSTSIIHGIILLMKTEWSTKACCQEK